MLDPVFQNFGEHVTIFVAGSTALGLVGHAVNTFPPPTSPLGKWVLGMIQFAVGQRLQSLQTLNRDTPPQP